jgi:hypothetical protein
LTYELVCITYELVSDSEDNPELGNDVRMRWKQGTGSLVFYMPKGQARRGLKACPETEVLPKVEWSFARAATLTGGLPVKGEGIAHSVGIDHAWECFCVLVELESGELVSIPVEDSNMRVCRKVTI